MRLHPFVRYTARSRHLPNRFMTVAYDCRCLYILSGRGRLYFEDAEYSLEPGTLAVYPAGKAYMPLSEAGEQMEFILVNFDYTEEFSENTITMSPVPAERVEPKRVQRTQEDVQPELFRRPLVLPGMRTVEPMLLELAEEYRKRNRYFRETGSSLFQTVLFYAARAAESSSTAGRIADRALNYLREHLSEPITNEDVARELNFHSYYLNRIVRQQTGQSLHQHLLSCRLNHAQRLLLNTDLSVEAVALQSGFQNAAHFSARFHRWFGVPPSVFRKNFCI